MLSGRFVESDRADPQSVDRSMVGAMLTSVLVSSVILSVVLLVFPNVHEVTQNAVQHGRSLLAGTRGVSLPPPPPQTLPLPPVRQAAAQPPRMPTPAVATVPTLSTPPLPSATTSAEARIPGIPAAPEKTKAMKARPTKAPRIQGPRVRMKSPPKSTMSSVRVVDEAELDPDELRDARQRVQSESQSYLP